MQDITSSQNEKTLQTYEEHADMFISGTTHNASSDVRGWMKRALSYLPKDAKILELGSAFGRDASDAEALGYHFQCTDAVQSFVTYMQEHGQNAYLLNAITDDLGSGWDMIYANCVFLHFTVAEVTSVLQKIANALSGPSILAFALKRGEGTEWSSEKVGAPRFFQYWNQEDLIELCTKTGFEVLDIRDGITTGDTNKIYVIARKKVAAS